MKLPLTKYYHLLQVWERIPLLLAASARQDEVEYQRLVATSRQRLWRFSEHLLAEMGLHTLTLIYVSEQLDAVGNYFLAQSQVPLQQEAQKEEAQEDLVLLAEASAYFFTINAQAWTAFCTQLKLDAGTLTAANHTGWLLAYCEEQMPHHAPTPEEMQELMAQRGCLKPVATAATLQARWQKLFHAMTRHSPIPHDPQDLVPSTPQAPVCTTPQEPV